MMQMMGAMGGDHGMGDFSGGVMGQLFSQFDTNGDGTVTADEARAGLTAQLEKYDANGDGTLSLDEFQALHSDIVREGMVDRFQALDNDGDGQVTVDEITAPAELIGKMQGLMGGATTQAPATSQDMMNDN